MEKQKYKSPYYFMDKNHNVVQCDDLFEWSRWFNKWDNRKIKYDQFSFIVPRENRVHSFCVSTVFLGLDHAPISRLGQAHTPVLFETMIFTNNNDSFDDYQTRCTNYADSLNMHRQALIYLKGIFTLRQWYEIIPLVDKLLQ